MVSWTGDTGELEGDLARLVEEHDRSWDRMTVGGRARIARKDPEAEYHWKAAESCEVILQDLRSRPNYATLCPPTCGCRGTGK